MGMAMNLVTGFTTAQAASFGAVTVSNGDSLQIKYSPDDKMIRMAAKWSMFQVTGNTRLISPKLHDNVVGITNSEIAANAMNELPQGTGQKLFSQDTLTLQHLGTAAAGKVDITSMLHWYADSPGSAADLYTWDQIKGLATQYMTFRTTLATTAAGQYGTTVAINSTDNQFRANANYAILGYQVSAAIATVGLQGPNTGNLRIGGPGTPTFRWMTSQWFKYISDTLGLPAIPVINAANAGSTVAFGVQDENLTSSICTWIAVLLEGNLPRPNVY
jgi:hypothetical protein